MEGISFLLLVPLADASLSGSGTTPDDVDSSRGASRGRDSFCVSLFVSALAPDPLLWRSPLMLPLILDDAFASLVEFGLIDSKLALLLKRECC